MAAALAAAPRNHVHTYYAHQSSVITLVCRHVNTPCRMSRCRHQPSPAARHFFAAALLAPACKCLSTYHNRIAAITQNAVIAYAATGSNRLVEQRSTDVINTSCLINMNRIDATIGARPDDTRANARLRCAVSFHYSISVFVLL